MEGLPKVFVPDLSVRSKAQLKEYFSWFVEAIPARIDDLEREVRATDQYSDWPADFSPASLDALGHWFVEQVETRERTAAEMAAIHAGNPYPIEVSRSELTDRTFAAAVSVAMYWSRVLQAEHPHLKWKQLLGSKNNVYYGHAVFSAGPGTIFNPVHLVIVMAYGAVRGTKTGARLKELHDFWSPKLAGA